GSTRSGHVLARAGPASVTRPGQERHRRWLRRRSSGSKEERGPTWLNLSAQRLRLEALGGRLGEEDTRCPSGDHDVLLHGGIREAHRQAVGGWVDDDANPAVRR